MVNREKIEAYTRILTEELQPAMGCTEPIAVAYAAARARDVLGVPVERAVAEVSGNIIKNVKSVIVPNTGGLRGIEASVAAGIAVGKAEKLLEVISEVNASEREAVKGFMERCPIEVRVADTPQIFYIEVTLFGGEHTASVRIEEYHTNVVLVKRDGAAVHENTGKGEKGAAVPSERDLLNIQDIYIFADTVDLAMLRPILARQIAYNRAIAEKLRRKYRQGIA